MARRVRPPGPAIVVALLVAALAAACGDGTSPPPSQTPQASLSGAIALTRGQVQQALGAAGIGLQDTQTPYQPPEAPRFAAAQRGVVQAVLARDPTHGFIAIYEFPDSASAAEAAAEQAAFIASGPGRVQFLLGTQFVMRQVGSTVVFYAWLPDPSDPDATTVATALGTIGTEVPVAP